MSTRRATGRTAACLRCMVATQQASHLPMSQQSQSDELCRGPQSQQMIVLQSETITGFAGV